MFEMPGELEKKLLEHGFKNILVASFDQGLFVTDENTFLRLIGPTCF